MPPSPKTPWSPVAPSTLGDQVFERLRERILRGDFAAGTFIREHDVSAALAVSRTPVRHALARLAAEGFLERLPNRGYRVPDETSGDLLELYPIISSLEVLAGRLSMPRLSRAECAQLREINQRFARTLKRRDLAAAIEANHAFHRLLSTHCHNRTLNRLLDDLRVRVARLEFWSTDQPVHGAEAVRQHEGIVDAIEQRRFAQALVLLRRNRLQTYTAFRQEIDAAVAADLSDRSPTRRPVTPAPDGAVPPARTRAPRSRTLARPRC